MTKTPLICKSDHQDDVLTLTTRVDKLGNVFFCVMFGDEYACFKHMSSALDYIDTNFKL